MNLATRTLDRDIVLTIEAVEDRTGGRPTDIETIALVTEAPRDRVAARLRYLNRSGRVDVVADDRRPGVRLYALSATTRDFLNGRR